MPWTCPACNRTLSRPNAWHQCVQKPLEAVFDRKEPHVYTLFMQVHATLTTWKLVNASATQNCIVYVAQSTFLIIRPMKTALDLKFYLGETIDAFPVYKTEVWGKRVGHFIRLFDDGDLDNAVWSLLKQSYLEDMERGEIS